MMKREEVKKIAEAALGVEVAIDYDTTGYAEIYTGCWTLTRAELDEIDKKLPIRNIQIEGQLVLVVDAKNV